MIFTERLYDANLPSVVVFVQVLVDPFVMQSAVDPVNEAIREHQECQHAGTDHQPTWQIWKQWR